jgi:hypothetical protein
MQDGARDQESLVVVSAKEFCELLQNSVFELL